MLRNIFMIGAFLTSSFLCYAEEETITPTYHWGNATMMLAGESVRVIP